MTRVLIALAICLNVCADAVLAQETVNYASVSGRVTDTQGAVVPGAQVTARQIGRRAAESVLQGCSERPG